MGSTRTFARVAEPVRPYVRCTRKGFQIQNYPEYMSSRTNWTDTIVNRYPATNAYARNVCLSAPPIHFTSMRQLALVLSMRKPATVANFVLTLAYLRRRGFNLTLRPIYVSSATFAANSPNVSSFVLPGHYIIKRRNDHGIVRLGRQDSES